MPKTVTDLKTDVEQIVGKPLFPEFTDPTLATELSIKKYDADMGSLKPFSLAQTRRAKHGLSHRTIRIQLMPQLK